MLNLVRFGVACAGRSGARDMTAGAVSWIA